MNRVIARLVLRALPAAGGIRPRLSGRFEGESGAALAPAAAARGPTAGAVGQADGASADRTDQRADHPPAAAGLRSDPSEHATVAEAGPTLGARADAFDRPGPDPFDGHRDPNVHVTRPFESAWTTHRPESAIAQVRDGTPIDDPQAARTAPRSLDPPLLPAWPLAADREAAGPLPADLPRSGRAVPSAATSAAPDIEIAIGRIEVRTPPARRSERPARAQPRLMSLEDYLARGRRSR